MDVINCYKSEFAARQEAKERQTFRVCIVGIIMLIGVLALIIFGKAW